MLEKTQRAKREAVDVVGMLATQTRNPPNQALKAVKRRKRKS